MLDDVLAVAARAADGAPAGDVHAGIVQMIHYSVCSRRLAAVAHPTGCSMPMLGPRAHPPLRRRLVRFAVATLPVITGDTSIGRHSPTRINTCSVCGCHAAPDEYTSRTEKS